MRKEWQTIVNANIRLAKWRDLSLPALLICAFTCSANPDLQESPLSISLSTIVPIIVNEEAQQLLINQFGIHNNASVTQLANASNVANIHQQGQHNMVSVIQDGIGNTVNLEQHGDYNLIEVIQQGDDNLANVTQLGEQRFVVHQIGNEMVVNITQYTN